MIGNRQGMLSSSVNYDNIPRYGYSAIIINATYTGPVIRVKRSSDNSTTDVYYDTNFTSSYCYINNSVRTEYTTWIGGSTGLVLTLYDQFNANNATAVVSPTFDYANKCILFATGQSFTLPNGTIPSNQKSFTTAIRHLSIANNSANIGIYSSGALASNAGHFMRTDVSFTPNSYMQFFYDNDIYSTTGSVVYNGDTKVLIQHYRPYKLRNFIINGVLNKSENYVSTPSQTDPSLNNKIGTAAGTWFIGKLQTIVFYHGVVPYIYADKHL